MVSCDDCNNWFHFVCVGVTGDIAEKEFFCENCVAKTSKTNQSKIAEKSMKSVRSSKTHASATSSAARRRDLLLARIEEERKLKETRDQEYLDKKYDALEMFSAGSTVSDLEFDDEASIHQSQKRIEIWVDDQNDILGVTKNVNSQTVRGAVQEVPEVFDLVDVSDPDINVHVSQSQTNNMGNDVPSSQQSLVQQNQSVALPSSISNSQPATSTTVNSIRRMFGWNNQPL